MSISSLLVPAMLFFALGMFACVIKSDLKFPTDMHKMLVIYLLIGIGLHGGKALAASIWGMLFLRYGLHSHLELGYLSLRTLSCEAWARSIHSTPRPSRRITAQ
jgi:hypothetical protein